MGSHLPPRKSLQIVSIKRNCYSIPQSLPLGCKNCEIVPTSSSLVAQYLSFKNEIYGYFSNEIKFYKMLTITKYVNLIRLWVWINISSILNFLCIHSIVKYSLKSGGQSQFFPGFYRTCFDLFLLPVKNSVNFWISAKLKKFKYKKFVNLLIWF